METKDLVLKALKESGQAMKTGEIAEKTGLGKPEVDKAIKVLVKEEKVISPKRCFYSPK